MFVVQGKRVAPDGFIDLIRAYETGLTLAGPILFVLFFENTHTHKSVHTKGAPEPRSACPNLGAPRSLVFFWRVPILDQSWEPVDSCPGTVPRAEPTTETELAELPPPPMASIRYDRACHTEQI